MITRLFLTVMRCILAKSTISLFLDRELRIDSWVPSCFGCHRNVIEVVLIWPTIPDWAIILTVCVSLFYNISDEGACPADLPFLINYVGCWVPETVLSTRE